MAEVSGVTTLIQLGTEVDAFTILFPFLLSWMLFYAAISKSEVLDGTPLEQNGPPVMAMIIAFFVAFFLVKQPFYQTFFSRFFGKVVVGLVSILGLLTLASFTGFQWQTDDGNSDYRKYIFYIAVLMAGAAFFWAGGFGPMLVEGERLTGITGLIVSGLLETGFIWFLVIAGAMLWVMSGAGNDDGVDNPTDDPDDEDGT